MVCSFLFSSPYFSRNDFTMNEIDDRHGSEDFLGGTSRSRTALIAVVFFSFPRTC